jgi:hypothetical protein
VRSSTVYLRREVSPREGLGFFCITTFMAWNASSIFVVESSILLYVFVGKGPRSSNSLAAEFFKLSSRKTVYRLDHETQKMYREGLLYR